MIDLGIGMPGAPIAVGASYRRVKNSVGNVLQRHETQAVVDFGPAFAIQSGSPRSDTSKAEHHDLQ